MWSLPETIPRRDRWMICHIPELLVHLENCEFHRGTELAARASMQHELQNKSPRRERSRARAAERHAFLAAQSGAPAVPFVLHAPATVGVSSAPVLAMPVPLYAASELPSSSSASPLTSAAPSLPGSPGPQLFAQSSAPTPAASPSPSVSSLGKRHNSLYDIPAPPFVKRLRGTRSAATLSTQPANVIVPPLWDDARTWLYESWIARLTAACGWPLTWVENPEWLAFCEVFIPGAPNPSRKVLTHRILPRIVKEYRTAAQGQCAYKLATIQCDGFTPRNRHHIVAFMITVDRKVFPHNTSISVLHIGSHTFRFIQSVHTTHQQSQRQLRTFSA